MQFTTRIAHIAKSSRNIIDTASQHVRPTVLIPWLLTGFAVFYYSLYVNAGLNLGGEGGTAAVIAMRLMAGQLPIVDTSLGGYNVMWFFPVAELFEITGPNYLALRWYFFAFCVASGLLVYFVVHGYTRNVWFSAIPAVLVILIPGMMFRNYMPFLGILNAFLLTRAFVMPHSSWKKSIAWMAAAGAGLGITFLFRIDLGIFCCVIFLGLAGLYPFGERGFFLRRSAVAAVGALCGMLLVSILHLPLWNDAKARGYDRAFLDQYSGCALMLKNELYHHIGFSPKKRPPNFHEQSQKIGPSYSAAPMKSQNNTWEDRGALARPSLSEMWHAEDWSRQSLAISTYLSITISILTVIIGSTFLIIALAQGDMGAKERALYPLTVLTCALTLFPQYFFFRPDTPHLSEMMVPYVTALATLAWAATRFSRHTERLAAKFVALGFAALCIAATVIYFSHAFPKTSAGTIAAQKKASYEFRALNGVNVKLRRTDALWLAGLRDAILRYSSPNDYVVCYPYQPTINFMTDRRSPLRDLYADNATGGRRFTKDFFEMVANSNPAIIVIDQRQINRTEASRFRNWAPEIYHWLQDNYILVGRYARIEVFVRPDKVTAPLTPESVEASD